jgi:glyoxylase-like metal-dependent hydrolase (beta-lactamase superfamily II)
MNAPADFELDLPFAAPPAAGAAAAAADGVQWLRMPLPFALDHINLWLVDGAQGLAAVDTGFGDAVTRAHWQGHFDTTMRGRALDQLVVTHYHPDHLGNAAWLAARFAVPVTMTHGEFLHAHCVWHEQASMDAASMAGFLHAHGLPMAEAAALGTRLTGYRRAVPELPRTFRRMIDGDTLVLGGSAFRVIAGFGHSPEHAALYCSERGVLVSGDMLLPRISTNISVSPGEPDGDPLQRFLDSLSRFEALPPDTLVLPSHGLPFRGIALRVAQLRAHHHARLAELEDFIRDAARPVSAAQVLPVLFRRKLDTQQLSFAMGEAIAHLNHLWHAHRVERIVGADRSILYRAIQ